MTSANEVRPRHPLLRGGSRAWPWIWPAAVAVGMAALTFGGSETDEGITGLGEAAFILPTLYLVVALLRRRNASWPVLGILVAPFIVLRMLDVIAPTVVFGIVALILLVWGVVDGRLRGDDPFRMQALGMLGFGALALVGLAVDTELGRYLIAAAWLLHGVWDLIHLVLDKVVARSYALWCAVLDIGIAVELVLGL